MAKVAVTKAKLEALADAIRQKAGLSGKKTLAELTQAVSDLGTGTTAQTLYNPLPKCGCCNK